MTNISLYQCLLRFIMHPNIWHHVVMAEEEAVPLFLHAPSSESRTPWVTEEKKWHSSKSWLLPNMVVQNKLLLYSTGVKTYFSSIFHSFSISFLHTVTDYGLVWIRYPSFYRLTSCSILYSRSLLASFSSASLQAFWADSSSCRTRLFKRAARPSFSFAERLLSSSRCCREFTVAPATA